MASNGHRKSPCSRMVLIHAAAWTRDGLSCMDSKLVQAEHLTFNGLHLASNTSNPLGFIFTLVTVAQLPGLNTLGIALVCFDYASWDITPIHLHPQGTEIITVLEGSSQDSFTISKNVGYGNAVTISAVNCQDLEIIIVASSVFILVPSTNNDVFAKAIDQVDKNTID
ncbi:putative germin-like protein 2-2 [Olea europaea var. sylvestris]|uniref:putative germin-like protein 2-2 n=1 Tax=Olea europaea var. sylvestris TaxID=158386 RepID=UPI000C1CFDB8|nr:putative germin-like protein 2-2 [Olea europaea var. sylvestris]